MSEGNIENITKSDSHFAPTFVDHHADVNFNRLCLINNIYIPKRVIYIYFLHAKSMVKKFKQRFYIRYLLIWICIAY